MQNPNEDTEWNDILRSKGILPPKEKEVSEDEIVNMIEQTIQQKQDEKDKKLSDMNLDELDELEDSEDEAVLEEYRRKRIAELKRLSEQPKFAEVREVSGQDYVQEVNKAGEGIWVVIHLYKQGIQQCALINQHLNQLAAKYPYTKFLKAIAQTCIPNFPDKNLPSVFVYFEGDMKRQFVGPQELRGTSLTCDELEYILGKVGAVNTTITEDPRPKIKDKMFADLGNSDCWSTNPLLNYLEMSMQETMAHTRILSPIKEEMEPDAAELRLREVPVTPTHKNEISPRRPGIKRRHLWACRRFVTRDDSGVGSSESCEDDYHPYHAYINPYYRDVTNSSNTVNEGTLAVPPKKLRETRLERCISELELVQVIGSGSFGVVLKYVDKSDGHPYAIKQLLAPNDKAAQNEIFAFSKLGSHPNIVRYYSSWTENARIMIQIEYCERGSLRDCLEAGPLHEFEVRYLLQHMAAALAHIHSYRLAHMDVKPDNIFLCDPGANSTTLYTYKLGDMGNVTPNDPTDIEEGDCRYMAKELLEDNYSQLFKADIFALGLTAYEAGGYGPLPKHGDKWHQLRSGNVPALPDVSKEINELLQSMLHPNPLARPTASTLREHTLLCDREYWSKKKLEQQLAMVLYQKRVMAKKLRQVS